MYMNKKIFLGMVISLFSLLAYGQNPDIEWAKANGGSTFHDRGESITEDGLGNIYISRSSISI